MAATALGLESAQVYRYVLLPSSFRIILPPLTSELLNLIKNTSVAFTIGLFELVGAARSMQEFSFQVFETFALATLFYLILNLVVVRSMLLLERRIDRKSVVQGRSVSVRVDLGGRRIIKKKKKENH